MTVKEVESALEDIKAVSGDSEAAHKMEDSLYADVLEAIADGVGDDPKLIAAAALKSQDVGFSRWYS